MSKIGIRSGYIWGVSKKKLITALGEYYTETNPDIIFNLLSIDNEKLSDKIIMNKTLDKLNIRHPKTYYYPFKKLPNSNDKCVIKIRYGSRGKGIVFSRFNKIKSGDISSNHYIQHFIPFEKEYRVGIDFNRVLGIREKMGIARIRNSKSCRYETRDIPELHKFAWKVFKKFKIEFTGMDIGLWNGEYIVIELNSSPTIGEYWAKLIARDLIEKSEDL